MGQEQNEYTWNLIARKLNGEASPEELLELENLLRESPGLHYSMQTITDLWQSPSSKDQDSADREEATHAFDRHLDRMEAMQIDFSTSGQEQETESFPAEYPFRSDRPRSIRKRVTILLVICLSLAMAGGWLYRGTHNKPRFAPPQTPPAASEIFTRNGSRTNMLLPDGTQVWLNAGSHLSYNKDYGATLREVSLTGEAFFDVAHNAAKPFIIHTERIDVRVLGTRFNVRSYPDDGTTEATLIRGSIEVSIKARPSEKIILKPNEKLVVANDDSTLHRNNPARNAADVTESLVSIRQPTYEYHTGAIVETSWVDNKLVFQDKEFAALAKEMERWYGVSIRFADPDKEALRFTGIFQKETIGQALDALKMTAGFNYIMHGNEVTITKE